MSEIKRKTISTKQARRMINTFGFSLIIYIALNLVLWYGMPLVTHYAPQTYFGFDPEMITMLFTMIMMVFTMLVPFRISARLLKLDINDYLVSAHLSFWKYISLCCLGAALMFIVTAVPSVYYILIRSARIPYPFVGDFTTRNNILKNIIYAVLAILVKPLCDEVIFRGIIQRQLGHYGRRFGVYASTFLYFLSFATLPDAIPNLFIGWYLALLALRYHSIIPSLIVHIYVALFSWAIQVIPDQFVIVISGIVMLNLAIAAVAIFNGTITLSIARPGRFDPRLWKILFTSFTTLVCIGLFIAGVVLSFL